MSTTYSLDVGGRITLRGVSEELHEQLRRLARQRGESLNATVIELLEEAVGLDARRRRLARYASWTAEDAAEFQGAFDWQRRVDDEDW